MDFSTVICVGVDSELLRFCLNVGWLYTRLVAFNSMGDDADSFFNEDEASAHTPAPLAPTESSTLLKRNKIRMSHSIQHFMSMELHLQLQLIELQGLLAQTQHEPRLKGPFPVQLYRSILTSLQSILDKLHSMRCVTSREEWHTVRPPPPYCQIFADRSSLRTSVVISFSLSIGSGGRWSETSFSISLSYLLPLG